MAKKSEAKPAAEPTGRGVEKRKSEAAGQKSESPRASVSPRLQSSPLVGTRVIYCGDNLEQLIN